MTVGERIHLLRRRLDWTQQVLARAAQSNTSTIARMERGELRDPGSQLLRRVALALETSTDFLLGLTDDPEPTAAGAAQTDEEGARLALS